MTDEQNERNAKIVELLHDMRATAIEKLKDYEIDCKATFQGYIDGKNFTTASWLHENIKCVETLRVLIERFDEILDNKE